MESPSTITAGHLKGHRRPLSSSPTVWGSTPCAMTDWSPGWCMRASRCGRMSTAATAPQALNSGRGSQQARKTGSWRYARHGRCGACLHGHYSPGATGSPAVFLGHSWGSIIGQIILNQGGASEYDGVIFTGTAYRMPGSMYSGELNAKHKHLGSIGAEWLSRDVAVHEAWRDDPSLSWRTP